MAIELTNRTLNALRQTNIEPNMIVKFDGYDILFSVVAVQELIRIGDPGLFIDGTWFIGGLRPIVNNRTLLDLDSTTTRITQQINFDEARGSSVSTMNLSFIDKNNEISALISPGIVLPEMFGRKVQVFLTFGTSSFFEDSVEIFKGFVTAWDSGAGNIKFKINHPENKKMVDLFISPENALEATINSGVTSLTMEDASTLFEPTGPISSYLQIEDEIIEFTNVDTAVDPDVVSGLTRGSLGTAASAHSAGVQIRPFYVMEGNPLDLALQIMMSGWGADPVYEDVPFTHVVRIGSGSDEVPNSIFFRNVNVPQDYNVQVGDTATITGAFNAANNITAATVSAVELFEDGYYIQFSGVSMVTELDTSATVSFFTQYNTMPDGMRMRPDEVDIEEHIRVRDFFHSATQVRIGLKEEETQGKEFLDEEIYRPIACYSIPRKARASVGFTIGPIPGADIKTLDETNVRNGDRLRLKRSTKEAFFNRVFYKYEDDLTVSETQFLRGRLRIDQNSIDETGVTSDLIIETKGLRSDLNAVNLIDSNAQRYLDRYARGAQIINPIVQLSTAVGIEINDIVVGDFRALHVTDTTTGNRLFEPRFFAVKNKNHNIQTGEVELECLDTGLGLDTRYCLMSPCSPLVKILNTKTIVIGPDPMYPSKFGDDEYRKWLTAIGPRDPISILIRDIDGTVSHDNVVESIDENTFTLRDDLPGTVATGQLVEFTGYVDDDVSDKQRLIYGFMTDSATFPDGENQYTMF